MVEQAPGVLVGVLHWVRKHYRASQGHHYTHLLAGVILGVVALASAGSASAGPGSTGPTISGPQIEQLLRANLGAAPGVAVDPSQIRCPATRLYGDGDVAPCSVPVGNGAVQVLLVTLFKDADGWRFVIGVQ